jgi:GH24 family phage-related lysozyme (muramidase)
MNVNAMVASSDVLNTYKAGIELLKEFEGSGHLTAYKCPAGVWTIGWGSTKHLDGLVRDVTHNTPSHHKSRALASASAPARILAARSSMPAASASIAAARANKAARGLAAPETSIVMSDWGLLMLTNVPP